MIDGLTRMKRKQGITNKPLHQKTTSEMHKCSVPLVQTIKHAPFLLSVLLVVLVKVARRASAISTALATAVLADGNFDSLSGEALAQCCALFYTWELLRAPDREDVGEGGCEDWCKANVKTAIHKADVDEREF